MNFFERIQKLDRRWIYLLVALTVGIPLVFVYDSPTHTTETTENIYQMIDNFAEINERGDERRAILMNFHHDASTLPELGPMEVAILRHAFLRGVPVFTFTILTTAAPLIDLTIDNVKRDLQQQHPDIEIVSGVHYINIGFKPPALYLPIILGMGDDIAEALETDAEGRNIADLPMMEGIRNYDQMNLVLHFSGSDFGQAWFMYARSQYGVNVASGITAVIAPDTYPYLQTGQLIGHLGGLKGAAEYEHMVDLFAAQGRPFSRDIARSEQVSIVDDEVPVLFRTARIGMNAQTAAHVMMIVFIIIGNVGYFIEKRKEAKKMDM